MWTGERLARVRAAAGPLAAEEEEMRELDRELLAIYENGPAGVTVLDLHTTSGPGCAFSTLDDSLANRRLALEFPVPMVLGLEEELEGTLLRHLTAQGLVGVGFEAGQHDEPVSIDRAAGGGGLHLRAAARSEDP